MENLKQKVENLESVGMLDNRIKELSFQAMQEASESNWQNVVECFRELAYICAKKGLTRLDFLAIRKDLIQAMMVYNKFAKIYIEVEEKHYVKH